MQGRGDRGGCAELRLLTAEGDVICNYGYLQGLQTVKSKSDCIEAVSIKYVQTSLK